MEHKFIKSYEHNNIHEFTDGFYIGLSRQFLIDGPYDSLGKAQVRLQEEHEACEQDAMREMLGDDAAYLDAAGIDDIGCK